MNNVQETEEWVSTWCGRLLDPPPWKTIMHITWMSEYEWLGFYYCAYWYIHYSVMSRTAYLCAHLYSLAPVLPAASAVGSRRSAICMYLHAHTISKSWMLIVIFVNVVRYFWVNCICIISRTYLMLRAWVWCLGNYDRASSKTKEKSPKFFFLPY